MSPVDDDGTLSLAICLTNYYYYYYYPFHSASSIESVARVEQDQSTMKLDDSSDDKGIVVPMNADYDETRRR